MRFYHIQVLVTQRCNAVCDHCDKAVGMAKFPDMEMTTDLMAGYVNQMNEQGLEVRRVTLSGGEPVLNKDLQGIIDETARMKYLRECRVLSNGLASFQEKRDAITLPDDRFKWVIAPLDDIHDPKSGKNEPGHRTFNRVHHPYWISPDDIGMVSQWETCGTRKWCGRGLDANGYSMCGQAPILGRLLGINPYPESDDVAEIWNTPDNEICKHCLYGLTKRTNRRLRKRVRAGKSPEMTKTFVEAFNREPTLYQLTGTNDA